MHVVFAENSIVFSDVIIIIILKFQLLESLAQMCSKIKIGSQTGVGSQRSLKRADLFANDTLVPIPLALYSMVNWCASAVQGTQLGLVTAPISLSETLAEWIWVESES